jgi:DNA adenine methylase
VQPLIKWPGGKSRELKIINRFMTQLNYNPKQDKYFSPFVGGGALFFDLQPKYAHLNDIDKELVNFYNCIKIQDDEFFATLRSIENDLLVLEEIAYLLIDDYISIFEKFEKKENSSSKVNINKLIKDLLNKVDYEQFSSILAKKIKDFDKLIFEFIRRKIKTTTKIKRKAPLKPHTHSLQFETALKSGFYTFIRDFLYNQKFGTFGERSAYFYYIREFCFGSMFRYNSEGGFNIPYGGTNYNKKNFRGKIKRLSDPKLVKQFKNGVKFYNYDFKEYFDVISSFMTKKDFVFFDPPYLTEFSGYSNNEFTQEDHVDLAKRFADLDCNGLMVIKRTDFIYNLYKDFGAFSINRFSKKYTYNVRGRNVRDTTHLIITNYDHKIGFEIIKN